MSLNVTGGKYSRTNYRKTGGLEDVGELASIVIQLRITIQHDSATGDVVTFSTEGYGHPDLAWAWLASEVTFTLTPQMDRIRAAHYSIPDDGSLVYMSVNIQDRSMGSLAATLSFAWNVIALIASR